jgi:hypothetical protein
MSCPLHVTSCGDNRKSGAILKHSVLFPVTLTAGRRPVDKKATQLFTLDRPNPTMKRGGRHLLVTAPPHSGGCRQGTYKVSFARPVPHLASCLSSFTRARLSGFPLAGFRLGHGFRTATHLAHHIVRPKDVWNPEGGLRIISPLPIHQKPVMVSAGRQGNGGPPGAVALFHQVDGLGLPMRKVANQLNTVGIRSSKIEFLNGF